MISITPINAASAVSSTIHLNAPGHKKGLEAAPDSSGAKSAASTTTQNLFSSILQSVEQIMGLNLSAPTVAATVSVASKESDAD